MMTPDNTIDAVASDALGQRWKPADYRISFGLMSIGALLLAIGGYLIVSRVGARQLTREATAPAVSVEQPERSFEGEAVVGRSYKLEFRLVNNASEPRRLVGALHT